MQSDFIEMYDLPAVSIISPQTEGILFRTPLDTRLTFPLYSSLVEHSKDRVISVYLFVKQNVKRYILTGMPPKRS